MRSLNLSNPYDSLTACITRSQAMRHSKVTLIKAALIKATITINKGDYDDRSISRATA